MNKNINDLEKNFLNEQKQEIKKPTLQDLQAEKMQLQIELLKQKKESGEQRENPVIIKENPFIKILKILSYILLAPLLIIGFFLIECAKEAGRTGGRRR